MSRFCFAVACLAFALLAGCQAAPTPQTTAAPRGTQLGDTGIRVSGTLQSGASTSAR